MIATIDTTDFGQAKMLGFTDEQAQLRPYAATIIRQDDAWTDVARKLRDLADAIEGAHCSPRAPAVSTNAADAICHAMTHGEGWAEVKAP